MNSPLCGAADLLPNIRTVLKYLVCPVIESMERLQGSLAVS